MILLKNKERMRGSAGLASFPAVPASVNKVLSWPASITMCWMPLQVSRRCTWNLQRLVALNVGKHQIGPLPRLGTVIENYIPPFGISSAGAPVGKPGRFYRGDCLLWSGPTPPSCSQSHLFVWNRRVVLEIHVHDRLIEGCGRTFSTFSDPQNR